MMKNISTFQIVLIAVFAILAVVGFVMFATFKGFGDGGKNATGAVVIWGVLPSEGMSASLKLLEKTHMEYKKVSYQEHSLSTFALDFANAVATGKGPDLILVSHEQLLELQDKLSVIPFSSIPQRTFLNSYVPSASILLTPKGAYGIPFLIDPLVLYYNVNILTGAGFATAPTSWEAVTGIAERVTVKRDDQSIVRSAIALGEYFNVTNARALISLFFLQAGVTMNAEGVSGRSATLSVGTGTSASGVVPGASALNFYTQFTNPTKTVYTWNRSLRPSREAFLAGDLAMYIGFPSEQPFLSEANPNLNYDMAPIPQPASGVKSTDYGNLYFFAVPQSARNAGGAFRVALAMTENAIITPVAHMLSMAPASRTALTPSPEDVYAPVYYPLALTTVLWLSPSPSDTDSVFSTMINTIVSGRKETRDALYAADQAFNELYR